MHIPFQICLIRASPSSALFQLIQKLYSPNSSNGNSLSSISSSHMEGIQQTPATIHSTGNIATIET